LAPNERIAMGKGRAGICRKCGGPSKGRALCTRCRREEEESHRQHRDIAKRTMAAIRETNRRNKT